VEARAQTGLLMNAVTQMATRGMVANSEVLPSRTCRRQTALGLYFREYPNPLRISREG